MNYDSNRSVQFVSATAFLLALTVWGVLSEVVLPNTIDGIARVVVLVLSSLGAYQIAFSSLFSMLDRIPAVSDRAKLAGEWHQVFTIRQESRTDFRYGKVLVVVDSGGIVISGENYRPDATFSSHWQSRAVIVEGQRLHVFFTSTGLTRGTTNGTMSFLMVGRKPQLIVGTFADSVPGPAYGEMRLFRLAEEAGAFREELSAAPR